MSKQLLDILLKDRLIIQSQYDEAIRVTSAETPKGSPMRYLIKKKLVSEIKLLEYLSRKYNLHSINLSKFEIDKKVIALIPAELVKELHVIPIQAKENFVVVAVCDPTRLAQVDKIKISTRLNVEAVLTTYSAFDETLGKYYGSSQVIATALRSLSRQEQSGTTGTTVTGFEQFEVHDIDTSLQSGGGHDSSGEAVVTLVNGILGECIRRGASDIHVEPYEKRMRVRLRVDGSLIEIAQIPSEMKRAVIARIKIMSRMDISESRIPQDGRIKLKSAGREVDFRVNTLPTLFGEKVVLRMLSSNDLALDLKKLGFSSNQMESFKKGIYSPNGMVLVTGPTGSGKTTTLYSALAELNQISDNISTVEDPVEYNFDGINQTQINKDIGLTFASVLRAMLRQDPDIILVGEIRDYETAEVAIQAALTGHLVLSTVHTNDAPSTITRLMNMGVEPFLVTSSVNTIIAQRLLRRVCKKCKQEVQVPQKRLQQLGFSNDQLNSLQLVKGSGCTACNQTGYKGRFAIYEILDFNSELKEMVLRGDSVIEIKKRAISQGMQTLRQSALSSAAAGMTSLEEALSLTTEE